MRTFRRLIKRTGISLLRSIFGVCIRDARTGRVVGRAAVVAWRGRLWVIGAEGEPVRPMFLPQNRETYWVQELGFVTHPPPDFPNVRGHGNSPDHSSDPQAS